MKSYTIWGDDMNLKSFFDNVQDNAENTYKCIDDYIGDNGLVYCAKCNTPMQCRVHMPWGDVMPYIKCKCEKEKAEKENEERLQLERKLKIERVRSYCFPEDKMLNMTFANDDGTNQSITDIAYKYCKNFDRIHGKGILFYGITGTGKTYYSCEIANDLIDKGYTARFTNFARILNELQNSFDRQDYIDGLCDYDLLIIDDLGIERNTTYALEQIYNVINCRNMSGKSMIVTTNLDIDKIKNQDNIECKRIYDRILESCLPVKVAGVNHRRKNIIDNFNEMKNILGL